MKQIYTLTLSFLLSAIVFAQTDNKYTNPVITTDAADPSIVKIGDKFYATGTSSEWAPHYPMFVSDDLVNWEQIGHVFDEKPEWTVNSFWAPEFYYMNDKLYCYYTARRKSDNISFIGVASAEYPFNKFTDHGIIIEHGKESIDAYIFDDNGELYISWKAYGLEDRPIELLGSKLSTDGLSLIGEPFTMLKDDERIGMEGQSHLKVGDYYYLIYSAGGCCGPASNYDVRVARSKSFKGPYEKHELNPILSGDGQSFLSGGHGTPVQLDDGRFYYFFHAYQKGAEFYLGRQPSLQEFIFTDDAWIEFVTGDKIKADQNSPKPEIIQKKWDGFYDNFKADKLKLDWTWNYPFAKVETQLKNNSLFLSGSRIGDYNNASVLCLRPQTPDYSYETKITGQNSSLKGLTMYGDDKNHIVFGVEGDKLILRTMKDNEEVSLFEVKGNKKLHLKVEVNDGAILSFYYSKNGKKWYRVPVEPHNANYLVRWDRIARPGLVHIGKKSEPARFSFFRMNSI